MNRTSTWTAGPETTGKLTWDLELKPGEDKKIEFTYSIEHDKDKPVS
mgnify:CR=1 FL=1